MTEVTSPSVQKQDFFIETAISAETAAIFYLRMKMEGVLDELYHEGAPDLHFFINWCLNPANVVYGVFKHTDDDNAEIIGMGFMNSLRSMGGNLQKAEIGFAFLQQDSQGVPISGTRKLSAGKEILYRFFQTFPVDYVFGTTATHNRLAVRYAQLVGMVRPSIIDNFTTYKGEVSSVTITHAHKDTFIKKYEAEKR